MNGTNSQFVNKDNALTQAFPQVTFGSNVQVIRFGSVEIGQGTSIGDDSWINACESTYPNISLRIGSKVLVGRRAVISSGKTVTIGDFCVLGPNVYIANTDHGYKDVFSPVLQQPLTSNGELIVEENCWFGTNVVVMGAITIGRGSVVGANSVVLKDVPPFSVVVGSPAKIVQMYNPVTTNWDKIVHPDQIENMLELRKQYPVPSRSELLTKLTQNCSFASVPAVVVGSAYHLDDRPANKSAETKTHDMQNTLQAMELLVAGKYTECKDLCIELLKLGDDPDLKNCLDTANKKIKEASQINEEDKYDKAYRTEWEKGHLRELIKLCYKTPDLRDNAIRFSSSEEFTASLALLKQLGHPAQSDVSLLDIGCGNGVACWSLAKAGYNVTGIDSSSGYWAGIGAARQLVNMDNVKFKVIHTVAEELPFAENSFNIIWMREVLHHIVDLPAFLKSVRKLVKKNGIMLGMRDVVIWNEAQRNHFFATHPFQKYTQDENCHYLQEYIDAFTNAGWIMERVIDPVSSSINTFPAPFVPGQVFSTEQAAKGLNYSLYSFVARNPG